VTTTPTDVAARILAAATLAEQAAANVSEQGVEWPAIAPRLADRLMPQNRRLIAASGPSHWGAVATALRGVGDEHYRMPLASAGYCACCSSDEELVDYPCASVAALLPLVDQIIRDLGMEA
jgi:hypothetical protein